MKIEAEEIDETIVKLDTYNSDLNLIIDASCYSATPMVCEGFAFMWAGARATHGATTGKFCFEVKIGEHLDVSHLPADEPNPHVVRVGFSTESSSMQLGEDPLSYGFGGTGKISTNCQFQEYGKTFACGDTVLGVADMDSEPVLLGFAVNGKFHGWAYRINRNELKGQALFPHILTKNVAFEVNFGQKDKPYFPLSDELLGFYFIGCLPIQQRISGARAPKRRQDCEIIMMCGLPGAGKSVWALQYFKQHPEKKYNILGTNNIIDKMKVMGLPRKRNYAGRWDVLIQMATTCLNKLFDVGSKLRRNYILDQTNVYPNAQRRKMSNFEGFKRIAVVVVPTDVEYKRRCLKRDREEGKDVPDDAVLRMKANFKLPEVGDIFKEVLFTELPREDAQKLIFEYNEEGKAAIGPARKHFKPNDSPSGFGNNRGSDSGRGGFSSRGGFDNGRGFRGGFGGNRGGNDWNRGGFSSGRGGYESGRGGYDGGRGGFNGGYGSNRGSYAGNRGGYNSSHAGYAGGHGGFDSKKGLDSSPQRFDRSQGTGNSPGGYGNGPRGSYGGYGDNSPNFGANSRGFGPRGNGRGRGDFGGRDYNYGGDNNSASYTGGNFGQEPALGAYDKSGAGTGRGQHGYRGVSSTHGGPREGSIGSGGSNFRGNYGNNDFNRDANSGYGGYQNYDKPTGGYRGGPDAFSRPGPQGAFKTEPGTETGAFDSGAGTAHGTRPGGKVSRWSAEVPQASSFVDRTSATQNQSSYSSYGAPIKTEPPPSNIATTRDSSVISYSSYVPPSFQGSSQAYGYQSSGTAGAASQPLTGPQTNTGSAHTGQGTPPDQQQWSQYYPQQPQVNQYFSQYYGQQGTGNAPSYGSYGAK
ncbi:heterogeneous nuclear ribonucleoprotein U-like protein 1 [Nephila pilipes]|uniref:Heterogeneous nuclear ribonucleoprotein U-like protein 1 n=1 Tax=Nephila pilipes TaxID=299642 RepID=A0A8X6PWX1_NEPPI|nr:heterogeneous nuclear ribonucleoprotein U-like protein 1 [Nephila pilipes]